MATGAATSIGNARGAVARRPDAGFVLALALALTLLNAGKPVAVDDPAYLRQAAWWAAHPFDPLGGEAPHDQAMVPAADVAAAPVAIAWLALGVALTGGAEWALKLWLFPFAWLLAWALHALLRLLAPSVARPWLAAAVLSPAILPSFGFMLDVPMLALAVAALAMFARDTGASVRSAVAAGVLAGLALQVKYSAAPILVALVACGLLTGRLRAGLLAAGLGLGVFAGLEALLLAGSGHSPLLAYVAGRGARDPGGHAPLVTAWRLVGLAGTAAPALIPLGLTALGAPRRAVHAALVAVVAGFAVFVLAPAGAVRAVDGVTGGRILDFTNASIGWMGPALAAIAVAVLWRAGRKPQAAGSALPARVIAAWLLAECALAPLVSASASVRRVLGAIAALACMAAWSAHGVVTREPARRADVLAAALSSVALGLGFWMVDVDSAMAERRALALVERRLESEARVGRVSYVGSHWTAFEHAASGTALRRVALGRSWLRRGDWLVVPFAIGRRNAVLDSARLALVDSVPLPHRLPVTTRRSYYDGSVALRRVDPGWAGARLWRVIEDGEALRPRAR